MQLLAVLVQVLLAPSPVSTWEGLPAMFEGSGLPPTITLASIVQVKYSWVCH